MRLVVLALVTIAAAIAYLYTALAFHRGIPISEPRVVTQHVIEERTVPVTVEVVVTATPEPTRTPIPTHTPGPTLAPGPTRISCYDASLFQHCVLRPTPTVAPTSAVLPEGMQP